MLVLSLLIGGRFDHGRTGSNMNDAPPMKDGGRRMRIGMVQLARARGKRGTDRECQKTRRPFSADGWNQASPMASILADALCLRYNDVLRRELFVATDRTIDVSANDTRG
ncbi:hypothetical protein ALC57_14665 [Trachymyrmex cornetzi]|uniref:Uncharacterized protein n=1 Tax=Trachymyrmex cornetzi TaxID=471704 RepID=A0A151IXV2_9HYME|nr:hypothetical protein ALC57_14665 [Trachymyrmex cornetzi]